MDEINKDSEIKEETESAAEETVQESVEDTEKDKLEALVKERTAELESQVAQSLDRVARMQAESDNYRKRMLREKEESVRFANERLITDLLVFLDNLDRAIDAAGNGGDMDSLISGLDMARSQLISTLDKNWGLKVIPAKGEEFDPMKHEACMQTVDESLEKETVLEEFQKGYMLHDRVLRPSKVKIGKPS